MNSFGFLRLKTLLIILFLLTFGHCAFWTGRFYFDYYFILEGVRSIFLDAHLKSNEQIREMLQKKINFLGTPIYEDDIELYRDKEKIIIRIKYSEYLFLGDFNLHKFNFVIKEVRHFR